MRNLQWLLFFALALLLGGCGSGGGNREFASEQTPGEGPVQPSSFVLSRSAPSLSSDGRQTVRLFAQAKDAGNVALAGIPVEFAAIGQGVVLRVINALTDANGQAEASLSVTDPVNRSLTIEARALGLLASTTVDIVGTTAAISGPASVVLNNEASFQVVIKDAAGAPVVGKEVLANSAAGNAIAVSPAFTDAQGAVTLLLNPVRAGVDTLTVSAAGASGSRSVQISSTSLAFELSTSATEWIVNATPMPLRVRLVEAGVPVAGQRIGFTATRGQLTSSESLTDEQGWAQTSIRSGVAGRSLITATAPNGTVGSREMLFVADRVAKIELQASPSTLGVTLPGATIQTSQVIAVVRDLADNPVRGARVNFSAIDPSAGLGLSQTFAISDEFGRATVTFRPGAIPTGANQIAITATIDCAYTVSGVSCANPALAPSDQTLLTASRLALQVRIGTGNEMTKVDESGASPVFNELPYGVLVTDSAGNPTPGVSLNATVVGVDYSKGFWVNPCAPLEACWEQRNSDATGNRIPVAVCPGEDLNENLLLDKVPFDEDTNRDGMLTPGNIAAAYFGPSGAATTGTTDDKGSSVLRIRFLRDRSRWVTVRVRVSASIPNGTEGVEKVEFLLPILATDVASPRTTPPGARSPYGVGACP